MYILVQTLLVCPGTDISTKRHLYLDCGAHFHFNNHDLFENVDSN